MTSLSGRSYTRVAVVQLDYLPTAIVRERSPLEDPLFKFNTSRDGLEPASGVSPPAVQPVLKALRSAIRAGHVDQLRLRVQSILAFCRSLKVRVVVFPEYSIPPELLPEIVRDFPEIVVVAGTHSVERIHTDSKLYTNLSAKNPIAGNAVAPVLAEGRILDLVPKLHPAHPELDCLVEGENWNPVPLAGLPSPLGVLVCLDFLFRESPRSRSLIAPRLGECRFLAVPSLTPHWTLAEFAGRAWEEAKRYGRPVLYANAALEGGTSIFVDEGRESELRDYPERVGMLEAGDEGVLVADVDLGFERSGPSRRYDDTRVVRPVAAANLLYRSHPLGERYASWLEETFALDEKAGGDDLSAWIARIESAQELIAQAGGLKGSRARQGRAWQLERRLARVPRVERLRQLLREVPLPSAALPRRTVGTALAHAAADVLRTWLRSNDSPEMAEVVTRLQPDGEDASRQSDELTEAARHALRSLRETVSRSPIERPRPIRSLTPAKLLRDSVGIRLELDNGVWLQSVGRASELRRNKTLDTESGAREVRLRTDGAPNIPDSEITRAEDLELWLVTRSAIRTRTLRFHDGTLATLGCFGEIWHLATPLDATHLRWLTDAFGEFKNDPVEDLDATTPSLLAWFEPAHAAIRNRLDTAIASVGHYIDLGASMAVAGTGVGVDFVLETPKTSAFKALERWLDGNDRTTLFLGTFGSGKSTALNHWAAQRWAKQAVPLPVITPLGQAPKNADPYAMLLFGCGLDDEPRTRAALELLIRRGKLIPCFDGFDELTTRLTETDLADHLSRLLRVAEFGGRVLVSCRDHYFPTKDSLNTSTERALHDVMGSQSSWRRILVRPLDERLVQATVRSARSDAEQAIEKIEQTYDLSNLVESPLLLGLVLQNLDRLPAGTIAPSTLYEAALTRWLDQTRSGDPDAFRDEQKIEFAEALADKLWRSGQGSCSYGDLQESIRRHLFSKLPDDVPAAAAFLEIAGGAFFVREDSDRFRFAHKSFLEYFLARALVRLLPTHPIEALSTKPLTREVTGFIGQILRDRDEWTFSPTLIGARLWFTPNYTPPRARQFDPVAAANFVRLMRDLKRQAPDCLVTNFDNANLDSADLSGEDLSRLDFAGASLRNATLVNATITKANFQGAMLDHSSFAGAVLLESDFRRASCSSADFAAATVDQCTFDAADLRDCRFDGSTWVACSGLAGPSQDEKALGMRLVLADPIGLPPSESLERASLVSGHSGGVNSVSFSPDGQRIASGSDDNTVRVWDAQSGQLLSTLSRHEGSVLSVSFSPDGQRIASGSDDNTVRVWDAQSGQLLSTLSGHEESVLSVSFSPDGQRIASGSDDNTVRVWDAQRGQLLSTLSGHENWVGSVSFSPDGQRIASESNFNTVRVWDAQSGQLLSTLSGHEDDVRSVSFSPDGQRIASGSDDNTVRVWDAQSGQLLSTLSGHERSVLSVSFSPDGQRIASGSSDNTVRVWDAQSGQLLSTFSGHERSVLSVSFSPDGQRIASGSDDRTVRVWDVQSGQLLSTLSGHEDDVLSVSFSPDGQRIASGSDDNTVRVWDAQSGQLLSTLSGHERSVWSVSFSPDGQRIAAGTFQRTLLLSKDLQILGSLWVGGGDPAESFGQSALGFVTRIPHRLRIVVQPRRGGGPQWFFPIGASLATLLCNPDRVAAAFAGNPGEPIPTILQAAPLFRSAPTAATATEANPKTLPANVREWIETTLGSESPLTPILESALQAQAEMGDRSAWIQREAFEALYRQVILRERDAEFRSRFHDLDADSRRRAADGDDLAVILREAPLRDWAKLNAEQLEREYGTLPSSRDTAKFFSAAGWNAEVIARDRLRVDPPELDRERWGRPLVAVAPTDTNWDPTAIRTACEECLATTTAPTLLFVIGPRLSVECQHQAAVFDSRKIRFAVIDPETIRLANRANTQADTLRHTLDSQLGRSDPFRYSNAITSATEFFGRQDLRETALADLRSGQSVGLFGMRKIGKSSLAEDLARRWQGAVVRIDAQGDDATPLRLIHTLTRKIERALRTRYSTGGESAEAPLGVSVVETVRTLHERLAPTGSARTLVIFDEIDRWVSDARRTGGNATGLEQFLRLLRSLAQGSQAVLVLLVTGLDASINRLDRGLSATPEGNPVYQFFREIWVRPMPEGEIAEMLNELGARAQLELSPEGAATARNASGGHPYFARLLTSLLLRPELDTELKRSPRPNGIDVRVAQAEAVAKAAVRFIDEPSTRVVVDELLEREQSELAQEVLFALSAAGTTGVPDATLRALAPKSDLEPVLDRLSECSLIERNADRWRIFSELVIDALRRRR